MARPRARHAGTVIQESSKDVKRPSSIIALPTLKLNKNHLCMSSVKPMSYIARRSFPVRSFPIIIPQSPLATLLHRASEFNFSYKVREKVTDNILYEMVSHITQSSESLRKTEILNNICKYANDLVNETILKNQLILFLKLHLIHSIRIIPQYDFSEISTYIYIDCFEHINICYQIINRIINLDPHFFPVSFYSDLIPMLATPIKEEQALLESLFHNAISDDEYQQPIFSLLISKLILPETPEIIGPCLRILQPLYLQISLTSNDISFFKEVIYTLWRLSSCFQYEKVLDSMCNIFLKEKPDLSIWCLNYLINHWPVQSGKKQFTFYNLFYKTLDYVPDNLQSDAKNLFIKLLLKISQTLNVSLTINTLVMVQHSSFITDLALSPHVSKIRENLNILQDTVDKEKKELIKEFLNAIKTENIPESIEKRLNWNDIYSLV